MACPRAVLATDHDPGLRFVVGTKGQEAFQQQFSHLYSKRLNRLKEATAAVARARWPGAPLIDRVIACAEGDEGVVIGTLYKEMALKVEVLDQYKDSHELQGSFKPAESGGVEDGKFVSATDSLILEDDSGRVSVVGAAAVLPAHRLSTGLVVALKGRVNALGHLEVEAYALPGMPAQAGPPPGVSVPAEAGQAYVLVVSGLASSASAADPFAAQLLVDYVGGTAAGDAERDAVSSRIARVVVAGDLIGQIDYGTSNAPKQTTEEERAAYVAPMVAADCLLASLAARCPVDVMPGANDPANSLLPQQPLHPCMFPNAARHESLTCVTNPYEARLGGRLFLGSSGQPVDDIRKYVTAAPPTPKGDDDDAAAAATAATDAAAAEREWDNGDKATRRIGGLDGDAPAVLAQSVAALGALEDTLAWRHAAPTCPDTLGCYPFYLADPFIIEDCPDVYFAGNQPRFATSVMEGADGQRTRVVCVPSFAETGQAVLVDVATLECTVLSVSGTGAAAAAMETDE